MARALASSMNRIDASVSMHQERLKALGLRVVKAGEEN
jgi:hypothetical protein